MIKLAICDDEETMVSDLKDRITGYLKMQSCQFEIDSFQDARSLLQKDTHYDIIFLDIQMNGISGMEAAQKMRKAGKNSFLVFVTISPEYVYDAFEVEASDYILKPISPRRFSRTMDRILHYISEQKNRCLSIQKGSYCKIVRFDDILYCEIINRIIYVHTKNEVIDYYCKIKELEKQLDPCFFRCHRSYLVNLRFVNSCEKGMAHLENSEQIPISRLKQQEFLSAVLLYMKGR